MLASMWDRGKLVGDISKNVWNASKFVGDASKYVEKKQGRRKR